MTTKKEKEKRKTPKTSPRKEDPRKQSKGLPLPLPAPLSLIRSRCSVISAKAGGMGGGNVRRRETWIGGGFTGNPPPRIKKAPIQKHSKERSRCSAGSVSQPGSTGLIDRRAE